MNAEIQKIVEDLLAKTESDEFAWRTLIVDTRGRTYTMRYHGLHFSMSVRTDDLNGKAEQYKLISFEIDSADVTGLVSEDTLSLLATSVVDNHLRYIVRTYNDTTIGDIGA